MPAMKFPGLTTIREASDEFNVPYDALRMAVTTGRIPTVLVGSRHYITGPVMQALRTGEGADAIFTPFVPEAHA